LGRGKTKTNGSADKRKAKGKKVENNFLSPALKGVEIIFLNKGKS